MSSVDAILLKYAYVTLDLVCPSNPKEVSRQLPVLDNSLRMLRYLASTRVMHKAICLCVIAFFLLTSKNLYHQRKECSVTELKEVNYNKGSKLKDVEQVTGLSYRHGAETSENAATNMLQNDAHDLQKNARTTKLGSSSPAYKTYIYNLPPAFNQDILLCYEQNKCFDTSESGYGAIFNSAEGINFRNTWHGLLELTMHHRLLHSAHRTMEPDQADVFYIPYYAEMMCKCSNYASGKFNSAIFADLYQNVTKLPYFKAGKPHFITLGTPEQFFNVALCSTMACKCPIYCS